MNLAEFFAWVLFPVLAVTRGWDLLAHFVRGDS